MPIWLHPQTPAFAGSNAFGDAYAWHPTPQLRCCTARAEKNPGHWLAAGRTNTKGVHARRWLLGLGTGILLQAGSLPLVAKDLNLSVEPQISTTGAFTVRWSAENPGALHYRLTRTGPSGRETLYVGRDTARFESGLPDGEYVYRIALVQAADANAPAGGDTGAEKPTAGGGDGQAPASSFESAPVTARVTHHSLSRAFTAFSIGALIFGTLSFWVTRHA